MSTRHRRRRRSMSWSRVRKVAFFAGLPMLLILLLPLAGSSTPTIQFQSEYKSFDPALKRWLAQSSSRGSESRTTSAASTTIQRMNDLRDPFSIFRPRMSASSLSRQLAALMGGINSGSGAAGISQIEEGFTLEIDPRFSLSRSFPSHGMVVPGISGRSFSAGANGAGGGGGGAGGGGGGSGSNADPIVKPEYLEPPGTGGTGSDGSPNKPGKGSLPGGGEETDPTTILIPEPQSFLLLLLGNLVIFSLLKQRSRNRRVEK